MTYKGYKHSHRVAKPKRRREFILNDIRRLATWAQRASTGSPEADAKFLHDNAQQFDKIIDNIIYWSNRKPQRKRLRPWFSLTPAQQKKHEDRIVRAASRNDPYNGFRANEVEDRLLEAGIRADKDEIDRITQAGKKYRGTSYSRLGVKLFEGTPQERLADRRRKELRDLGITMKAQFVVNLHPDDTEIITVGQGEEARFCLVASTGVKKFSKMFDCPIIACSSYLPYKGAEIFYVATLIKTRKRPAMVPDNDGFLIFVPYNIERGYIGLFTDTKTGKKLATKLYKTAANALKAAREAIAAGVYEALETVEEDS